MQKSDIIMIHVWKLSFYKACISYAIIISDTFGLDSMHTIT